MKIKTLVVGPIETNCYIISDQDSSSAFVVDAGANPAGILSAIEQERLNVKAILTTHGHFDHVTAVKEIKDRLKVPFLIHMEDSFMLSPLLNPDGPLTEGLILNAGDLSLKVIHTPGHSPGCVCLYCEKDGILFSGDTLFYADHGRCDLHGGSYKKMIKSLEKLFELPEDTAVYPGHGQKTTIGDEKKRGLI
ncbi:MAG: MBL fold metallo-hydrolase [Candidatus Margulisiibacteriota bacterium]